jgi:hypothetical protein
VYFIQRVRGFYPGPPYIAAYGEPRVFATREITLKEIVYRCMAQKLDASGFILIALEPGHRRPFRIKNCGNSTTLGFEPPPLGIDFLAMPFGEPMLFRIASAYGRATRHRMSPLEFGPLEEKK